MLQEKDQLIEELTRKLMQKEQLVEMLRLQLDIGTHWGLSESKVHVKVKQEPADSGSPPSLIQPPSFPFRATGEMVAINQAAIKEEEVVSPGLLTCTRKERTCRFSREQMMQKGLRPQEGEVQKEERGPQNRGPMLGNLQRMKGSHRPNHYLTEQLQRQAHLGQQQRLEVPQQTPQV